MRTISAPLAARLALGSASLVDIWKITRRDGEVFRFTNLDVDLDDGTDVWKATNSFNISAISASLSRGATAADMAVALSDEVGSISRADVERGLFDRADITIEAIDWKEPELGKIRLMTGRISNTISDNMSRGKFTLLGLLQRGIQRVGESYGPECPVALGSARCTINLAGFTQSATVTAVTNKRRFRASITGTNQVDNYFQLGVLTWLTGDNAGTSVEVLLQTEHDADEDDFVVSLNTPYIIGVGDTFSVVAGCDKRLETCRVKFSNHKNYQGFPISPSNAAATDKNSGGSSA